MKCFIANVKIDMSYVCKMDKTKPVCRPLKTDYLKRIWNYLMLNLHNMQDKISCIHYLKGTYN